MTWTKLTKMTCERLVRPSHDGTDVHVTSIGPADVRNTRSQEAEVVDGVAERGEAVVLQSLPFSQALLPLLRFLPFSQILGRQGLHQQFSHCNLPSLQQQWLWQPRLAKGGVGKAVVEAARGRARERAREKGSGVLIRNGWKSCADIA